MAVNDYALGDEGENWSVPELEMFMQFLRLALAGGPDDGVGDRVRRAAVRVRTLPLMAQELVKIRHGQYTPWEAFVLGGVSNAVLQMLSVDRWTCQRVLSRWEQFHRRTGRWSNAEIS